MCAIQFRLRAGMDRAKVGHNATGDRAMNTVTIDRPLILSHNPCPEGLAAFDILYPEGTATLNWDPATCTQLATGPLRAHLGWAHIKGLIPTLNLQGADLRGADLSNANLSSANLQGADLRGANLQGANLQGVDLYRANLQGADLRGADLWDADLSSANLSSANLRGVDLRGVNLWDADLSSANLHGANLQGVDLRGADLSSALMPEGWEEVVAHKP